MSNLIEKLAVQSLVNVGGELIFSKEKFAELIVWECANQLPRISEDYYTGDGIVEDAQKLILEHFGVDNERSTL